MQGRRAGSDKHYKLIYSIKNLSDENTDMDLLIHEDTAYNNNDLCEGYYVGENRITNTVLYSKSDSKYTEGATSSNIVTGVP